jgi:hypothetical protein
MKVYQYHVEDGQFSFDFEAPLLGNIGDVIKIYDASGNENGKMEVCELNEIEIVNIDFDFNYIECVGLIGD